MYFKPVSYSPPMASNRIGLKQTISDGLRESVKVRWNPSKDLTIVVGSYLLLVAVLYTAFNVVTSENVAPYFILYGPVSLLLIGVVLPVVWNTMLRKRPLADTGITRKHALVSLALGGLLGAVTYMGTLAELELPVFDELFPLFMMAITVGLFEAVFFRGWIQLSLDRAFGAIPAVVLGAAFYSLYHIGYGMEAEELLLLFILGITFAIAFRVTKNILVMWPFYTWIGGLYTNLEEGLSIPFESAYGFALVLVSMFMFIGFVLLKLSRDNKRKAP